MERPPTWDRLNALFHEALDLDPDARETFLTRIAEANPELAAEVRSLLAAHVDASGFLAGSAAGDFHRIASPGDRIGPYRIVEETGRGGMGVVFRALRDDENFTKEVAIKLMTPALRSGELMRRFRAERQILAMLDHPAIARLLDGGTAADGTPYLVMDFVAGRPLLRYCDENRLNVNRRLAIFLEVCDAVQFAHQRLVIHRDLKPDNILVTEEGRPKLLDFGVAKLLAPEADGSTPTLTAPMARLLTPDYASPEQIRGDPGTVAADVYSLGVILYELLAGRRPLEFRTRTAEELLRVVTETDPVPPSHAVTRAGSDETASRRGDTTARLRRRLSGDLDYIVLKALEKDPARRYGSVDQLARDIRRHVEGRPVLARGGSTAYLVSRFVRRHRVAVVTGSLVAISLIAGLAGTTWQAGRAGRERDRAQRRFEEVKSLAHAVVFDLHDAIQDLPGSTPARKLLVEHARQYLDGLSREAKDDPTLQHELGVAYGKIGDVQGRPMFPNLGQSAEALESYHRSLDLLQSASAARPESLTYARDVALTTQRLADLLNTTGRRDEAMDLAHEALGQIERLRERYPEDPYLPGDLILSHDRIGDWKLAAADTQGAMVEREFCMNLSEEMFRKNPRDAGYWRGVLINCCKSAALMAARNDREGALASYRRAERLGLDAVAALGENTEARRDLSIVYGLLGVFIVEGGEIDSGLAVYDQGMKISEELAALDPDNALAASDVALGHLEIGSMLSKAQRYEAAVARFGEAFDRFSRLVEADSTNVDSRLYLAQSGRGAGEACARLSRRGPTHARSQWRARGISWLEKSLAIYDGLEKQGALSGEDAAEPAELTRQIAALRGGES